MCGGSEELELVETGTGTFETTVALSITFI